MKKNFKNNKQLINRTTMEYLSSAKQFLRVFGTFVFIV